MASVKTALGIFWHDLKQLLRNPLALIVVIGLIVLPSVYAWYSIEAMWNPYSHTDGLKVAVVNNDAGTKISDIQGVELSEDYQGSDELDVGSMMVDAMKENESFDWQFVDAAQGTEGLDSGEYYAEFILPESFSEDFLSVLSGDPTNPTIEYWVNEKYNAVALEVTDAGAGVVDALINRVFSAIVADAMSDIVKEVASDIVGAGGKVSSQVQIGLNGAVRDLHSVSDGLDRAEGSIDHWRTSVSSTETTLDDLKETVPDLRTSLDDGKKILEDARTAAHEVTSAYSSALSQGSPELSNLLADVSKRVKDAASAINASQGDVTNALNNASKALNQASDIIETLIDADPDSKLLERLEDQTDKLQEELSNLESASSAVNQAAQKAGKAVDTFAQNIEDTIENMEKRNDDFNSKTLPMLDTSLDSIALVMGSLDGALGSLEAQIDQTKGLLDELDKVLEKTKDALGTTRDALEETSDSLEAARSDLSSLAGTEAMKNITELAHIDVKSYGSFMSSPVKAQMNPVYPVNSYGAGVAPFYTNLAIWVGCFMLIAVLKLEVDPTLFPGMRAWEGYLGRLFLFTLLAILQGAVATVGDLMLGVQAVSEAAFVAAGLVVALCFVNIVYALAITFKHVGKALAVIFLIVQIPGASGMYPIQLMPEFFQALYPFLPFTYGMDAMREAIGGFYGSNYAQCIAWLVGCSVVAIALALVIRPAVLNMNRLFDRKLTEADLFITEEHGLGTAVVTERRAIATLLESDESRPHVLARAKRFAERYSVAKQAAPLAIVALTAGLALATLLLDPDANGKLIELAVFIAAVVVVFCACVAFEYAYDNVTAQIKQWSPSSAAPHDSATAFAQYAAPQAGQASVYSYDYDECDAWQYDTNETDAWYPSPSPSNDYEAGFADYTQGNEAPPRNPIAEPGAQAASSDYEAAYPESQTVPQLFGASAPQPPTNDPFGQAMPYHLGQPDNSADFQPFPNGGGSNE